MVRRVFLSTVRSVLVGGTAVALAASSLIVGSPPHAAAQPANPCPEAFPVEDLIEGQLLTGWTVERGTVPQRFDATVIGVLDDGIAQGLDMIMVDAASTAIDRYGIWAGMSGSPVYAADGRLVGAIAYGLATGASSVAGVTPAAEMYRLLDNPGAGDQFEANSLDEVELPPSVVRDLTGGDFATQAQAEGGLHALPVPMAVSGTSTARLRQLLSKVRSDIDLSVGYRSGSAIGSVAGTDAPVPGGNAAVSMAFGASSFVGVGTVTAVCDDEVLSFGHPMNWSGRTTMGLHAADALFVQEDLLVPFKVANPLGLLGTVDQDRVAGVKGSTSSLPGSAPIRTTLLNAGSGEQFEALTRAITPDMRLDIAASHVLAAADRVADSIGDGQSIFRLVVGGHTSSGQKFRLARDEAVASQYDMTLETAWLVLDRLWVLTASPDTRVTIDKVRLVGTLDEDYELLRTFAVKVRSKGRWINIGKAPIVKAEKPIRARVITTRDRSTRKVTEKVTLPALSAGKWKVQARGGYNRWPEARGGFQSRLKALRKAPTANEVTVSLNRGGRQKTAAVPFDHAVARGVTGTLRAR